jgi:hypothetical protein
METAMTPEQMKELASRLSRVDPNSNDDGYIDALDVLSTAADLIRQMAEPPTETGPWEVKVWPDKRVVVDSDDFTHDVSLIVCGDFESDEQRMQYARMICERLNTAPQPDDTALLRQALDSLVWASDLTSVATSHKPLHEAIAALRARLDGAPQPDDSPLADLDWERLRARESRALDPDHQWAFDLIRGAPQPARVPMTECEASHLIAKAFESAKDVDSKSLSREIARAVERHHGIRSEE